MHRLLIFLGFLCAGFAFLSVVWILIPAPAYHVWLYSVAVSEWSLWFGACALIGIISALLDYAFFSPGKITSVAVLLLGASAFLISLYPLVTAFQTAREKNFSLSFARYFDSLKGNDPLNQFETYVYKSGGEIDLKMDVYAPRGSAQAKARASSSFTAAPGMRASAAIFRSGTFGSQPMALPFSTSITRSRRSRITRRQSAM